MTRFISFLIALIVLLSATVEIASFVLDHKSWLQENYIAARDYVVALTRSDEPALPPQACGADCPATAPSVDVARRCDDIEQIGKKILCHITLPKTDAPCSKDCGQKDKPGLPRNWIQRDKSDIASVPAAR